MEYNKTKVLKRILEAAKTYDTFLKDRELLVVAKQKNSVVYYEMQFFGRHFKHFTGVNSSLSANRFYSRAIRGQLSEKEFEIKDSFLVEKKMEVLENAVKLPFSARMAGEFNYTGIKIQADIGSGNNSYTMAFRRAANNMFYPVSVLNEDIRKSTKATAPIIAIMIRNRGDETYSNLSYQSKNVNFDKLHIPAKLRDIIASDIMQKLKPQQIEDQKCTSTKATTSIKDRIAQERSMSNGHI